MVVQSNAAISGLQQDARRLAGQASSPGQAAAGLRSAAQALACDPPSARGLYAEQLTRLLQTQAPQV